jgi:hypothetical protein
MFSGAGGAAMVESEVVAPLYRPKETYSERVTTFLTKPQAQRFTRLLQVWTALDRVQNPEGKEWTEAEGARRLIDASLEAAFAELGGEPKTDEEMNKVIARLIAEAKKAK